MEYILIHGVLIRSFVYKILWTGGDVFPPHFLEEGLTGVSDISFHFATTGCASSRHSILRLWRAPSSRGYSRRTGSLFFHTATTDWFPAIANVPG